MPALLQAGAPMRPGLLRALAAASLLCLQACASLSGQVVQVEEDDSGRTVELKPGQILDIRLMTFPARGLTLSLGSIVTPTLALEGQPAYYDDTIQGGVAGTGSFEAWRFRAVQPGHVNVRMDYRLQWEATGAPTRSVSYDVVVKR